MNQTCRQADSGWNTPDSGLNHKFWATQLSQLVGRMHLIQIWKLQYDNTDLCQIWTNRHVLVCCRKSMIQQWHQTDSGQKFSDMTIFSCVLLIPWYTIRLSNIWTLTFQYNEYIIVLKEVQQKNNAEIIRKVGNSRRWRFRKDYHSSSLPLGLTADFTSLGSLHIAWPLYFTNDGNNPRNTEWLWCEIHSRCTKLCLYRTRLQKNICGL